MKNRRAILEDNQRIRSGNQRLPTRLEDGYVSLRIPKDDWQILRRLFPDLESKDHVVRLKAWKDLEAGDLGEKYRVQERGPRQVQRATRLGNKGIIIK